MANTEKGRDFLRANWNELSESISDQQKGMQAPPVEKPWQEGTELVDLPSIDDCKLGEMSIRKAISNRKSHRRFKSQPLMLDELGYLLWATQAVRRVMANGATSFRSVPSAGSRHAIETYLIIENVTDLEPGLYRYLPVEHKLAALRKKKGIGFELAEACCGQTFMATAPVTLAWTAVPYRMEWRYTVASPKLIALDAGHVCQNLYLAAESIGAGTCAIGAYFQGQLDNILGVDGKEEFAIYLAPVGRI